MQLLDAEGEVMKTIQGMMFHGKNRRYYLEIKNINAYRVLNSANVNISQRERPTVTFPATVKASE